MFCGRGGVASGKVLREYWIFYTARRRRKKSEVLGVKMVPYIHILGFFLRSKWCHIYTFSFLRSKCCKIYTFSSVFGQNATIYIHILGFFWDQNAATYTHLCPFFGVKMIPYIHILFFFFIKMLLYIHILFFFLVKMLQHIHICVGFWDQNATIYTHSGGGLGSKCCHIYTFLEFNFFRKNEKKKTIDRITSAGGDPRPHFWCAVLEVSFKSSPVWAPKF